ncbi:acetyltransferase [Streptomyces sp. NRRL F-5755]|uniref:GNAT family N-acetyltransferase n=1 Tax=Streptomyces sp. NRRL F-5755 TaxID=1519475 RepID=UPI0006B058EE|nr:GNAT family protein [Streptomyces sp. NRRL F-5755]KOU09317.1 acetyltransferase [Streptomyces sp. NRRL F-5755]
MTSPASSPTASPIPPVVPAGRLRDSEQPTLALSTDAELRPWRPADAQVLVAACQDPDIVHWNRPARISPDGARDKIAHWHRRWHDEQAAIWAVAGAGGGAAVGLAGIGDIDLRGGSAEFLYWLLPAGRGRGLAVSATVRISRWAMDELGLHRLRISHSVANPASCRVAERAGFRLEGTMRSALLHADGWHDEHLHARVAGDDWPDPA